ncbi:MAG TPA: ABATE domain-containing protein [Gemmatimonadales bacterium]|nr:ABATE domain-containing protein [Gemmatimonadales bacterium]
MVDPEFTLLGDAIWLDFVNTARGRVPAPPDLLPDPAALDRWAIAQDLEPPNGDGPVLKQVLTFRERLSALAEALHAGIQAPSASIVAINEQLSRSGGVHQLTRVGGEWQLRFSPARRPAMLEAIAQSAAVCLADPLRFVRRCAGESCSLFFMDDSPNQGRRWCNATICGGQVKVERRRGLLR